MYVEAEYAESRLHSTIVRLTDGTPVYVKEVRRDKSCVVTRDVNREGDEVVHLDDLNPLSPPLGYVNFRGRAYYVSRKPMRRDYRQGVRTGQIEVLVGDRGARSVGMIMKCVEGKFPAIQKANEMLVDGSKSVALSRDICLSCSGRDVYVMYKWHRVGTFKDGAFDLVADKDYIKPLLGRLK